MQPHLANRLLFRQGREESTGTSKPSVMETNVDHSSGLKAQLADVGLMVPSHERGLMMMAFICSCRNKKLEPSSIYTFRKVHTIRGCLEGLACTHTAGGVMLFIGT